MHNMDESRMIIEMLCRNNWSEDWIPQINVNKLITLAEKNKILSSLADFIFRNNIGFFFKESDLYGRLKESVLMSQRDKEVYKSVLCVINGKFSEYNIDFCLLKGLSLSYGAPRDFGDLDLLIHEENLQKSIEIMEDLGFSYQGDVRNTFIRDNEIRNWEKLLTWSNQYEFLDQKTGLLVELHTQFFERDRVYRINLDSFLNQIENFRNRCIWSAELNCKILSPEDSLWLLSMHNSLKRSASRGKFILRNIIDINNLLEHENIDWEYLIRKTADTDTLLFLVYSLEMTCRFFTELQLKSQIAMGNSLLSIRKKNLKKSFHRCYHNLDNINYFRRFIVSLILPFVQKSRFKHKMSSIFIFPILFPSLRDMRVLYNWPGFLLIFAYFFEPFRWFRIVHGKRKKCADISNMNISGEKHNGF